MAQPGTQANDSATKSRITTHMNTSHRDSLALFLQHYCHVLPSSVTPSSTTLTTLNLNSLILTSQSKRYYIPFHPSMSSFSEVRARMKTMHAECLRALDLSDVKIASYVPPQTMMHRVSFFVVVMAMVSFSRGANFVPGSRFYQMFGLGYVPNFAWFCATLQPLLFPFMMGIHALEAVWMARTRLKRHGVRRWGLVWWMWVGTCFIEGVLAFQRLDGIAREKEIDMEREEKEKR